MKLFFLLIYLSFFTTLSWSQCEDFEMTLTAHHPTCTGFTDGRVEIMTSGGTGDIDYTLLNAYGDEFIGLPGGTDNILDDGCYYVAATDELGCELSDSICLIDPLSITADVVITDPTYPGACDGVVGAESVEGYQGPFDMVSYYWTIPDAPNASEITDVCAGEYTLTINDAQGCTGIFDFALGSLAKIPTNPQKEIQVFANRTARQLIVKNLDDEKYTLKVMNLAGQIVFDTAISDNNSIFTPQLNKGVYLYSISTKTNVITTGKFVF